jgi:hypothetical protein
MARFPSLSGNGGPGYETNGRENFDHAVEFGFDYGNVELGVKDVRKQLSDLAYEINKTFTSSKIPQSKSGGTMFSISPKISQGLPKIEGGLLSSSISLLADGNKIRDALAPAMGEIGQDGKSVMIRYANRIDTGTMVGSIKYSTRRLKNSYIVRIGWLQLWYKYFGFQENGTSSVPAMRSVLRTYLEILPRVRSFADKFTRSYTRSSGNARKVTYK